MVRECSFGGVVSWIGGNTMYYIKNCYNVGEVKCLVGAHGGIAGYCGSENDKTFGTMEKCYSIGKQNPIATLGSSGTAIGVFCRWSY